MHAKISSNERRLGTRQGGGEKSPEHSRARRASDLAWSSETRRARVGSPFFSAQWFQPDGYNSTSKMILKFLSYHACVSGFLDLHELFCNMIGVTDTGARRSGWHAAAGLVVGKGRQHLFTILRRPHTNPQRKKERRGRASCELFLRKA